MDRHPVGARATSSVVHPEAVLRSQLRTPGTPPPPGQRSRTGPSAGHIGPGFAVLRKEIGGTAQRGRQRLVRPQGVGIPVDARADQVAGSALIGSDDQAAAGHRLGHDLTERLGDQGAVHEQVDPQYSATASSTWPVNVTCSATPSSASLPQLADAHRITAGGVADDPGLDAAAAEDLGERGEEQPMSLPLRRRPTMPTVLIGPGGRAFRAEELRAERVVQHQRAPMGRQGFRCRV